MTPKEKAQELYFKFYSKIPSIQDEGQMQDEASKQCALIAVDEILNELEGTNSTKEGGFYWQEVKQEIEKL
jgi:hypothetical protein